MTIKRAPPKKVFTIEEQRRFVALASLFITTDKQTKKSSMFRKVGSPDNISLKKRPELLAYQIKILQEVLLNHGYKENKWLQRK